MSIPSMLFLAAGLACSTAHCRASFALTDDGCAACGEAFGPATEGPSKKNYAPSVPADFQHMRLEVLIPDMNRAHLDGTCRLTFAPVGKPLAQLTLDAKALNIRAVRMEGRAAEFKHVDEKLQVTIEPPVPVGEATDLQIEYSVDNPPLGLIFTPESANWPGRPAQVHSQGQTESNSYWFPCHDFPNEKLTTELIATVPAGYIVSSNGKLISQERVIRSIDTPTGVTMAPFETFHWTQNKPHVNYLVSMVVGKFDVVDVGDKSLAMPVYVPPGRGGDVPGTYGRTRDMIRFFESALDEPYPWDRYAQLLVWNFHAGGMENTSATTMYDTAIISRDNLDDFEFDGLISHELGHQWFGDLITCNSWEYIWLNEGFATYMTQLWFEHRDGNVEYQRRVSDLFSEVISNDRGVAPAAQGMASNVYRTPWETFRRGSNPYAKGASVLHMLRVRLGDGPFFKGVQDYVEQHKLGLVENNDLRYALESASGQSLEQFFEQWTRRPGVPRCNVKLSWDEAGGKLAASLEQTQTIDGDNPAFEFELPIVIKTQSGMRREILSVTGKSAAAEWTLDSAPTMVAVDPDLAVLAEWTIDQTAERWLAQFAEGPTWASRAQAARALGRDNTPRSAEMLRRLATDTGADRYLRVEAVKALAAAGADGDIRSLLTGAIDCWEVREATTNAVASVASKTENLSNADMRWMLTEQLSARARKDSSVKVRAAAIRAIGKIGLMDAAQVVVEASKLDSQDDTLRQASIDAIADMKPAGGFEMVLGFTKPGFLSRTRAAATGALPKVAQGAERDRAYEALVALLSDAELRTRRAAGEGLVELGDPRGIAELAKSADAAPTREIADMILAWQQKLQDKLDGGKK